MIYHEGERVYWKKCLDINELFTVKKLKDEDIVVIEDKEGRSFVANREDLVKDPMVNLGPMFRYKIIQYLNYSGDYGNKEELEKKNDASLMFYLLDYTDGLIKKLESRFIDHNVGGKTLYKKLEERLWDKIDTVGLEEIEGLYLSSSIYWKVDKYLRDNNYSYTNPEKMIFFGKFVEKDEGLKPREYGIVMKDGNIIIETLELEGLT